MLKRVGVALAAIALLLPLQMRAQKGWRLSSTQTSSSPQSAPLPGRSGEKEVHALRILTAVLIVPALQVQLQAAQGGAGDGGPATSAQLAYPGVVKVDAAGNLYFAEANNSRIRKVTASNGVIDTIAGGTRGTGGDGGPATAAQFFNPQDIAVDTAGNLYIADQ
jgi:hypothetical protein